MKRWAGSMCFCQKPSGSSQGRQHNGAPVINSATSYHQHHFPIQKSISNHGDPDRSPSLPSAALSNISFLLLQAIEAARMLTFLIQIEGPQERATATSHIHVLKTALDSMKIRQQRMESTLDTATKEIRRLGW